VFTDDDDNNNNRLTCRLFRWC